MLKKGLWIVASLLLGAAVTAQSTQCPEFMYDYIEQTSELCAGTGRNQICYGSNAIEVQLRDSATAFAEPGDITDLSNVDSIQTSGLDEAAANFGMALMQVQADVEGAIPGQVVTFLLMGNVSVDGINEGEAPMQAFRFNTGIGAPTCENSNYDALMIDSPDGLTINFSVNGVDIELGSTAIIVGKPDDKIDMLVLEGHGRVTAMGETVEVEEGFWTQIPMDAETGTIAVAPPEEPVPFGLGRVIHLPLNVLYAGQNIALNKPVTADASQADSPPENAVNGIVTGSDNWNAGSSAPHSIEIDLLGEYSVGEIRLQTSQFPEEQVDLTTHNIYVADSSGVFTQVHTFEQETRDNEWLIFTPENPLLFVRYVRVETVATPHHVSWGEIEVYATGFYGCVLSAAAANNGEASNLRSAPSLDANIVGLFRNEDRFIAVGQRLSGELNWWQLEDGSWIRSDRVVGRGSCTFLPES